MLICLLLFLSGIFNGACAQSIAWPLVQTIEKVKPSVVGVGTVQKTRRPPAILMGTGFVVANGFHVITNAHVIPKKINKKKRETLVIFFGRGENSDVQPASIVATDEEHDLSLLKIPGPPFPALNLGDSVKVREGELYAFTGFPLGAILGLYAATTTGIISSITPIAIPIKRGQQMKGDIVNRLQKPYMVFQLDATAYPGNSGSPLYNIATGSVIGIINKVFVKGTKEHAISNPSGITYAIPSTYAHQILKMAGITQKK
jgi:S1-C subfamily serine protease